MTAISQRNIDHEKPREYVKTVQRQQQQITLDISTERLAQIKAYIKNAWSGQEEQDGIPLASAVGVSIMRNKKLRLKVLIYFRFFHSVLNKSLNKLCLKRALM
jgi:hypothetical protein